MFSVASDRAEGGSLTFWWRRTVATHVGRHLYTHSSRPMYPGQAPTIRCNWFNTMVASDLSRPKSLHFTANTVSILIDRFLSDAYRPCSHRRDRRQREDDEGVLLLDAELWPSRDDPVLNLQGEKEELNVQAQFEAFAWSEEIQEIQEGGEPMSFDALVSDSSEVLDERIGKARAYAQPHHPKATYIYQWKVLCDRRQFLEFATSWCRTGTTIFPREGLQG